MDATFVRNSAGSVQWYATAHCSIWSLCCVERAKAHHAAAAAAAIAAAADAVDAAADAAQAEAGARL